MQTTKTVAPISQKKAQLPILEAYVGLATRGRCLCWLRRLWPGCAGCLPAGRRHRAPPRLEHVGDAHHKQVQQSASADCLDRLTQEKPSLRIAIYTNLWR